jgi:hypothetical protein
MEITWIYSSNSVLKTERTDSIFSINSGLVGLIDKTFS